MPKKTATAFTIRNVNISDIKEVYKLLVANRPYVGLNSRYTYFLLARDFSDTCMIVLDGERLIAFSSGYVPPKRPDTFFNWEIVVHKDYRGLGLQKTLLLYQIRQAGAKFFEGTINPSNKVSRKNFVEIALLLKASYQETILFSEEDFENDGHEAEVLFRIGPIAPDLLENLVEI
ncbi:MAG: GNAT family N-acetyltransferase [Candidatus Bathyarchaeota archaeon]|nr:GNAT family N-acetyltransferase [Candidatus Bathyarchaeota archaeon]